eukprot:gene9001-10558_t
MLKTYAKSQKDSKSKEDIIETPAILTISSYFKGSAFLVKTPTRLFDATRPIYCISCAHITHPFNFPALYKEESHQWIFALGEQNIKAQLEYRDPKTGRVLHSIPLEKPFHLHPNLDLVCFEVNIEDFQKSSLPFAASILELESYEHPRKGHTGRLFGYQLVNEKDDIMLPLATDYKFNVEESSRHFVQTKTPSPMGICGGPAVNFDNEVVGMIEGLVKLDQKSIDAYTDENRKIFYTGLNSNTVYIPSQVLKSFIASIDLRAKEITDK